MFTAEDIKARARKQPFVSFRLLTSAGQDYDVTHPDLIWVGTRYVHVGTAIGENPTLFDKESWVAVMHITSMDDLPAPSLAADKNGPPGGS